MPEHKHRLSEPSTENNERATRPGDGLNGGGPATTLTVPEVARMLRISRTAAYEAVERGEIPGAIRVGRTIRIVRKTFEEWLARA